MSICPQPSTPNDRGVRCHLVDFISKDDAARQSTLNPTPYTLNPEP